MRMTISPPQVASHHERLIKVTQSFRSHNEHLQSTCNFLIIQNVNEASSGYGDDVRQINFSGA